MYLAKIEQIVRTKGAPSAQLWIQRQRGLNKWMFCFEM